MDAIRSGFRYMALTAVLAALFTITSCFSPQGPLQLTFTVQSEGSGTTDPAGKVTVSANTPVPIVATALTGWTFAGWSVVAGNPSIANPNSASTTATLTTEAATVLATFLEKPKVYVANFNDGTVSVFDGYDGSIITTVTVGTQPGAVAVNAQTSKVYVAHSDGETRVIDATSDTVVATLPYTGNDFPSVAVDPSTNTVFAASLYQTDIFVIDGSTDTLTGSFDGDFSGYAGTYPTGMEVNSTTGKLYINDSGAGLGEFYVYNATTYALITSVSIDLSDKGDVAVNEGTNRVYSADVGSPGGLLYVFDGSTDTQITAVSVGDQPTGVAVNTTTDTVYVSNTADGTVSVINGANNTVTTTVTVGNGPVGVAVSEVFNLVYVVNSADGTVSVIDGATNTVVDTITVGTNPQFIDVLE